MQSFRDLASEPIPRSGSMSFTGLREASQQRTGLTLRRLIATSYHTLQ